MRGVKGMQAKGVRLGAREGRKRGVQGRCAREVSNIGVQTRGVRGVQKRGVKEGMKGRAARKGCKKGGVQSKDARERLWEADIKKGTSERCKRWVQTELQEQRFKKLLQCQNLF
jgi:hypothetical protein